MFEGIVLGLARVARVSDHGQLRRLEVDLGDHGHQVATGGSVAVNGTCLTSVGACGSVHSFDVIAETLQRTNLGELTSGDRVNIELPLRWGGAINGHLVQGHVDTTAVIHQQSRDADDVRLSFDLTPEQLDFVVEKGSVAIDGVSLTVADVDRASGRFSVALIPYTLEVTTLGLKGVGARVNIEVDHQARLARAAVAPLVDELRRDLDQLRARLEGTPTGEVR